MGFLIAAQQVSVMMVIILAGWILFRLKLIKKGGVSGINNVLVYVVNPCVVIHAFQISFDNDRLLQLGLAFAVACGLLLVSIALAKLLFPKRALPDVVERRVLRFGTVYTNLGFYGIPLVTALIGVDAVFYLVAFILAFNVFVWTHGIAMFSDERDLKKQARRIVTNPNIVGAVLAVLLFIFSIQLPDVLGSAVESVAGLNTALSMIFIGSQVATISLRSMFTSPKVWYGTLMRNVVVSLVVFGILTLLPLPAVVRMVALIAMACPVGVATVQFSVLHKIDAKFSTQFLCVSTAASILTLPSLLALAGILWVG
ncbi:MAG: AEC family transporter [Propionibacteriaceae bacterium]|jgi:predicted permease|nr:AEC family transporter [Propionibacteriaceae bacterium]